MIYPSEEEYQDQCRAVLHDYVIKAGSQRPSR